MDMTPKEVAEMIEFIRELHAAEPDIVEYIAKGYYEALLTKILGKIDRRRG